MVRIIVEGWRFIPHSYAIFNQFQCLEMLKRPEVELFHKDSPYGSEWQPVKGLFDEAAEAALRAIPSPSSNQAADATLRIDFPLNFEPSHTKVTCVWGTSELGLVLDGAIKGGKSSLQKAHRNSDIVIIAPSNWSRGGFIRSGAAPSSVVLVPLGVDASIYKQIPDEERNTLRRKLGWEGFVFLHIGAMTGSKGMHRLLKAFAAVMESHPEAKLVLKGLNSLYNSETLLVKTIQQVLTDSQTKRILQRLTYIGETMSFSEMAQLYQAADAYVSPYEAEGFNMPVLEAAACGLPVICTKGGPTDDFTTPEFALHIESQLQEIQIDDGQTGSILIPDVEHLIFLMQRVMERDGFRANAGRSGPDFVASRFTWKHIVDQLLDVLLPNRS